MEKLSFTFADTNETVDFFVLEQTRVNGVNYLLVTESEEDDGEEAAAYILKDMSAEEDTESLYEMVEDDRELDAVSKVFAELLEDIDLES